MIKDTKVIAVTPAGRRRFMAILAPYIRREHERGLIDEWLIFDNCYTPEDSAYAVSLTSLGTWVRYVPGVAPHAARNTGLIHQSYAHMTDASAVYVRLDDDICYLDPHAIDYLVRARLENEQPWIIYPTIYNNTRMSYMMQQDGLLPPTPVITNHFLDVTAWRDGNWARIVHDTALPLAQASMLGAKSLTARKFSTGPAYGALDRNHGEGRISINCYAVLGRDIVGQQLIPDEEHFMADLMPRRLGRGNALAANTAVVHFAYHCQPGLEEAGYREKWQSIAISQT